MTQEEKAKAYDEALKVLHKYDGANIMFTQDLKEEMFPELKESEDEKIVKELLTFFRESMHGGHILTNKEYDSWIAWLERQKPSEEALEYLRKNHSPSEISDFQAVMNIAVIKAFDEGKKQGEQKPNYCHHEVDLSNCSEDYTKGYYDGWNNCNQQHAQLEVEQKLAWSEEDDIMIHDIDYALRCQITYPISKLQSMSNWIFNLKDRVQSKQEWSEEDREMIDLLIAIFRVSYPNGVYRANPINTTDMKSVSSSEIIDWLKSLKPQNWTKEDKERYISCLQRLSTGNSEQPETINSKWFKEHVYPQSTWKPSDEQMMALRRMKTAIGGEGEIYKPLNSLYEDLNKLREKLL